MNRVPSFSTPGSFEPGTPLKMSERPCDLADSGFSGSDFLEKRAVEARFSLNGQIPQRQNGVRMTSNCGKITVGASNSFTGKILTGISGSGARVEVVACTTETVSVRFCAKGKNLAFTLSENARIIERYDGALLVVLTDSDNRYAISTNGTLKQTEEIADTNGDDIYGSAD